MFPVKEAVDNAIEFARKLLESGRTGEVLLEEVETGTDDHREVWLITLSLPDPSLPGRLSRLRQYKTFAVDGQTGAVLSMKIRQLSGAA